MAPAQVPVVSANPGTGVDQEVSKVATREAHRGDDAEKRSLEVTLPDHDFRLESLARCAAFCGSNLAKAVAPPGAHRCTSGSSAV